MATGKLLTLILIFFLTSVVSVVTGSTSLITVPVMIAVGIEPHVAVAMVIFAWHGVVDYKLGLVLGLTMFLGALVGGYVSMRLPRSVAPSHLHLSQ